MERVSQKGVGSSLACSTSTGIRGIPPQGRWAGTGQDVLLQRPEKLSASDVLAPQSGGPHLSNIWEAHPRVAGQKPPLGGARSPSPVPCHLVSQDWGRRGQSSPRPEAVETRSPHPHCHFPDKLA